MTMDAWSNIQISPQDPEIVKINNLERTLGELPENVKKFAGLSHGLKSAISNINNI